MSNKNDQNSLQPSLSGQLDAPPGNSVINDNFKQICRDFIWGLCNKGTQCKYRHELDFEAMKKTLKFCHDYQNPSGCTREHCTYLHTSKEEESSFFATRTLPRELAERHANITVSSAETIPQIALFIQESLVGATPPPPPSASVIASLPPQTLRPATMPLQQLPPPPPPPPPPVTTSATTIQPTPLFTVPPRQPTPTFSINQPPPPLPVFDASRPPPPIPAMVQPKNTSQKRQAPNDTSAGRSKLRKTEEPKPDDALCDACVQREIRIESYRQDMEKMNTEDEYQTLLYKKKLMEYQKQRDILRKLINSDYKFVQEFLDDVPQYSFREPLSNLNSSFLSEMSPTAPKHNHQQFLLRFMDYMFSNTRGFESSSVRVEESLRTLSSTPRRINHQSPDILQALKDILGQATSSERSVPGELSAENSQSSSANGVSNYRRYSNGQRLEPRAPPPPAPLPPPAPAQPPPAPVAPPAPPPAVNYPHYPPPYMPPPRAPATRPPLPPYYHYQ